MRTETIPTLLKKAQASFNKYIRTRDQNKGCISCGKQITDAGHYRSVGQFSALRFNEMNVNGQCRACNCFLHGNLIEYRKGLVNRYGEEKVLYLESITGRLSLKKWHSTELVAIVEEYKNKYKEIQTKF
jgi:hypothetical protein